MDDQKNIITPAVSEPCPKCGTPVFVKKDEVRAENVGNSNDFMDKKAKEKNETTSPSVAQVASTKQTVKEVKPKLSYAPNPFMAKELDIEGVKMRAEQGDSNAMTLQCFRYEMGIGTEIDLEKSEKLDEQGTGFTYPVWINMYSYSKELANPYTVAKNG